MSNITPLFVGAGAKLMLLTKTDCVTIIGGSPCSYNSYNMAAIYGVITDINYTSLVTVIKIITNRDGDWGDLLSNSYISLFSDRNSPATIAGFHSAITRTAHAE